MKNENKNDLLTASFGRENWTLEDYQDKDISALERMIIEEPAKFKLLEDNYFGVNASDKKKSDNLTPQFREVLKDERVMEKIREQILDTFTKEQIEEYKKNHPELWELIMNPKKAD
ncbi:hypothetical protein [Flavobacterium johnsoniae]|uniref:Uncharacterized protein n=1 Tax=Flavobacterium johnsoniae TaxID=986 RepID=A0A1M5IXW4_FLAJO|nr:hypothetical protein [Flavobacterium johnsoniae]SHG33162.1 hypothetical protein SAMN05444388_102299 [Flavobacterium johnsoniae]